MHYSNDIAEGFLLILLANVMLWDISIIKPEFLWLMIIVLGVTQVFIGITTYLGSKNKFTQLICPNCDANITAKKEMYRNTDLKCGVCETELDHD